LQLSALLPKLEQRFYSLLGQKVGRLWKKNPGKVNPKKIDLGNSAPFLPIFPTLTKKEKSLNSAGLFNGPFSVRRLNFRPHARELAAGYCNGSWLKKRQLIHKAPIQ